MAMPATPTGTALASAVLRADQRRRTSGLALALAGSVLFSAKAIFVKLSYRHGVDAVTLITLRMALSVPFFAITAWWTARSAPRLSRAQWLQVLMIGLSGYYAASFLDFLGLQYVTAALERLILYLSPTMVLLMSAAFLHRPIARRDVLALALSYGGIGVAFWRDVSLVGPDVPLGALLVFGAAVCYATYLVLSGEVVRQVGALRLTALAMIVASLACALQFLLLRPLQALDQPLPVYGWSLANALLSTVLPVFATMMAVERIGAARVAVASIVGPVATIVLGYLALDEPITVVQLAGAALVVAGVLVISRPRPVVD